MKVIKSIIKTFYFTFSYSNKIISLNFVGSLTLTKENLTYCLCFLDENEDLQKLAENEIISCQKEIAQLKHQVQYLCKE